MSKKITLSEQFDADIEKAISELKADKGKHMAKIDTTIPLPGRSDLWLVKDDTKAAAKRKEDKVVLLRIEVKKNEAYLICLG
jgi:hypothetical protein